MARYLSALLALVITCMFIASCNSNSTDTMSVNITAFNDSLLTDSNVVNECSFSLIAKNQKNENEILVIAETNPTYAIVSIDHKPVWLARDSNSNYSEKKREVIDHYSNKNYQLTTDLILTSGSGELATLEGLMTLTAKNGKVITKHIVGTCGD